LRFADTSAKKKMRHEMYYMDSLITAIFPPSEEEPPHIAEFRREKESAREAIATLDRAKYPGIIESRLFLALKFEENLLRTTLKK
jgi:hypothetical protein